MKILITGGSGFVGSTLARYLRGSGPDHTLVVFDNLRRRGSESNIAQFATEGITFVHGDVRNAADLDALPGSFDVLIEASAEPSVLAGIGDSPRYVLDTNLLGAMNCLEFARHRCGSVIFLSTSRIYSIEPLTLLPLDILPTRFDLRESDCHTPGVSLNGINEHFPCDRHRSYYGASKLAAELLCQEYAAEAGLPVAINRCGVIAGPGQFGKTDQGVFTLWVVRHFFGRSLKYQGFQGKGLQVRDLLHPLDLCELVSKQIESMERVSGSTFNVGGGRTGAVSLQEFTVLCQRSTSRSVAIAEDPATNSVDIPWYISDHSKATEDLEWVPKRSPAMIVEDIVEWIRGNEDRLSSIIV